MKRNSTRPRLWVTGDARNVVAHAGSRLLCDVADSVGLTDGLSAAMAPTKTRRRGHDRGRVLVDLAVMLADGGEAISDLAVLRDQPACSVRWRRSRPRGARSRRSTTPCWRGSRSHARVRGLRRGGRNGPGVLCDRHRRDARHRAFRETRRGTDLQAWVRVPSADRVSGRDRRSARREASSRQRRVGHRFGSRRGARRRARSTACRSRERSGDRPGRLGWAHTRVRRRVPGPPCPVRDRASPHRRHRKSPRRRGRITLAAGDHRRRHRERDGAEVAEITDLVDLSRWPEGTRTIARREDPHPGAQLTFTDIDGHRFQVFVTDSPTLTSRTSKRFTAVAGERNARSATPKTPASRTCPPRHSRSTPHGLPSCSPRTTSSPGPDTSASATNSPMLNPNGSDTACCTPRRSSPAARGAHTSASPRTGHGPTSSSTRSPEPTHCSCAPETSGALPRNAAHAGSRMPTTRHSLGAAAPVTLHNAIDHDRPSQITLEPRPSDPHRGLLKGLG